VNDDTMSKRDWERRRGLNPDWAQRLAKKDAAAIVELARERPVAGLRDLRGRSFGKTGRNYRYTPELPARRFATQWDEYLEKGELPGESPPLLVLFGNAQKVWDTENQHEENWAAYCDQLYEICDSSNVAVVQTYFPISITEVNTAQHQSVSETERFLVSMGDVRGEAFEIHSLYAIDFPRYELVPGATGRPSGKVVMPREDQIQDAYKPRPESWRHRIRLALKRPIEHSHQWTP
jgi:hypothetical protein